MADAAAGHGPDDYVVATGDRPAIREFLDLVFGQLDLDWKEHVEIDPRYFRPAEVDHLEGDAAKARPVLGWEPARRRGPWPP